MRNILLFGCIWGLCEAVVGTMLHILPFGSIAGFLLYPIGFYCLFQCYLRTGNAASVLYCGILTATLKLSSALFVAQIPIALFKPTIFILLETALSTLLIVIVFILPKRSLIWK